MTIVLPKDLRGFAFDRVLLAEMNDIDVDLLLPALFFKAVTGGRNRARRPDDSSALDTYLDALTHHPEVRGFDSGQSRRLLNRLVRTTIIKVVGKGQAHQGEQKIQALSDQTLLCFKPGYPDEASTTRQIDDLVYDMLVAGDPNRNRESICQLFADVFGLGVDYRLALGEPDGHYDGKTELDTITRLELAYIDGFNTVGMKNPVEREPQSACPMLAASMAFDFRRLLYGYQNHMSAAALGYHFKALINFELFIYSVKLFHALPELVADSSARPAAMFADVPTASPPDLYLDFTGASSGLSFEMAVACTQRDLSAINGFIFANLYLRQLHKYLMGIRSGRAKSIIDETLAESRDGADYLAKLLDLRENSVIDGRVEAAAAMDEERICEERLPGAAGNGPESFANSTDEIERATATGDTDFDRLVLLLADAQSNKIGQNVTRWFRSVGGIAQPHGILRGVTQGRGRVNWRYQPSNDLLATLVMLAAVDIPEWDDAIPHPQPIRLRDFLEWLDRRFGIIVDRPPSTHSGAEAIRAAQENLQAMLNRLNQMGVFRDLSDDFTIQRLIPPYVDVSRDLNTVSTLETPR